MKGDVEFLKAYFKRINFWGEPRTDYFTLKALQELHVQHIPFENFNPILQLPVSLKPEDLFGKLVLKKRGGYCYEQNLLFLRVLKTIGFNARGITGRVILGRPKKAIAQRTHMLILIEIEDIKYICDTGFGGQVLPSPIALTLNQPQKTRLEEYQIVDYKEDLILQSKVQKNWKNLYKFDLQTQYQVDYKLGNWYTSTHPDSHFTKGLTVTLVGGNCRYILHNNEFVTHYLDQKSEKIKIQSTTEVFSILKNQFGLEPLHPERLTLVLENLLRQR